MLCIPVLYTCPHIQAYPDAIAQCVYTAFIHAFPASWSSFDTDFKSALVELVHLWQTGESDRRVTDSQQAQCVCIYTACVGTRPMPELWKRWNFEYLDPPNSLKTIGEEDRSPRPHEKSTLVKMENQDIFGTEEDVLISEVDVLVSGVVMYPASEVSSFEDVLIRGFHCTFMCGV